MEAQPSSTFTTGTASLSMSTIVVDEAQTYQQIEGFGASITDSAAYLLNQVAPTSARDSTMNDLFTRNGHGIGLSFIRNPMGSTDLARTLYSYDDNSDTADPTLANFSIAHDLVDVLPLTLKARQLNPQLKIMANPWSPPGWMKTNGTMIGQLNNGTTGVLMPTMYAPFANYFVKYLQAYSAAGVNIDYISLQNEPLYIPPSYPGMSMSAATQTTVLRDFILPALTTANLSTRVLIYDHNWDGTSFPQTVLADPAIVASTQVAGIAWHGYGGNAGAMTLLHNNYPSFGAYLTEHSGGTWVSNQGQADFEEITHVMRNWGKAYVKWSLALDENLGPHYGGCGTCTAPITVNSTTGAITYNLEYYTMGQFSKYVLPGATRVYSSNTTGLISSAYVNPDTSKALVVFNDTLVSQSFQVQWGTQVFSYTLPKYTGATFTWSGTQSGVSTLNAKSQINASGYSSVNGFESEPTSDANAGFDLGYSVSGSTAVFKNVDFGSGVSGLNVRLACNGGSCGGTVEFHLDSAAGPIAASATVQSTAGWQNWQTIAGTVSGTTSGKHDVYVVIKAANSGANGVGNLNWFQFN
jgi:glucosylceramidase